MVEEGANCVCGGGLEFVCDVQMGNILIVEGDGWVGGGRKDCSK